MKYHAGQVVMLLDTEFKLAGSAVICSYEQGSRKYEVDSSIPINKEQTRFL